MNTQPPSKIDKSSNGSSLLVHSIFHTIQGEGPFAGSPAVFIRLAGCNLQCPGCDTEYTEGANRTDIYEIFDEVAVTLPDQIQANGQRPLIVITGGEPFRQPIEKLVEILLDNGCLVQIETNGTLFRELSWRKSLTIVCSPKTSSLSKDLWPHIDALKYVAKAADLSPIDGLPKSALDLPAKPYLARQRADYQQIEVYLQPMDEKDEVLNKKNMEAVKHSCLKFGHRLCLQVHKIIGVD